MGQGHSYKIKRSIVLLRIVWKKDGKLKHPSNSIKIKTAWGIVTKDLSPRKSLDVLGHSWDQCGSSFSRSFSTAKEKWGRGSFSLLQNKNIK